jgi:hypothetical protein
MWLLLISLERRCHFQRWITETISPSVLCWMCSIPSWWRLPVGRRCKPPLSRQPRGIIGGPYSGRKACHSIFNPLLWGAKGEVVIRAAEMVHSPQLITSRCLLYQTQFGLRSLPYPLCGCWNWVQNHSYFSHSLLQGYQNCRFTFRTVLHTVGRPVCHPSKLVLYSLLEMLPSNIKLYFVKRISQPWIVILCSCVVGTNDSEGCS